MRERRTRASPPGSRRVTATAGFLDVDRLLGAFASGVADALGDELVGVYVHGSYALAAFDPLESDVDFLVATESEVNADQLDRLRELHRQLGNRLDGSYLPRDVFRRFDPDRVMHPHVEGHDNEPLRVDHHGGETVVYRYVLRKCGVVLVGPPPRDLIDAVSAADLCWGVRDILVHWWRPMLDRPPDDLLDARYRAYAVVTMCRMRFTLAVGDVISKPAAAAWAVEHVDLRWHDLIRRAAARGDCGYEEAVAFVRDTFEAASC
jgi:predicted nucleotidyltransferase